MAPLQDLEVQQKRELEKKDESTIPARVFLPNTDIFETDDALTVVMEMPGVNRRRPRIEDPADVLEQRNDRVLIDIGLPSLSLPGSCGRSTSVPALALFPARGLDRETINQAQALGHARVTGSIKAKKLLFAGQSNQCVCYHTAVRIDGDIREAAGSSNCLAFSGTSTRYPK